MITNYFPMETTPLHLYKGKLKEALTLVVAMTPEERRGEAVSCWNDYAGQLQNIVEKPEPNFDATLPSQGQQVLEDLGHSSLAFDNVPDCLNPPMDTLHCERGALADISATDLDNSLLLTPPIKVSPLGQYHSGTILDKSLYGPDLDSTIEDANSINRLVEDKLVDPLSTNNLSSKYTTNQAGLTCVGAAPMNIPQGTNMQDSMFPMIEHCDDTLLLAITKDPIEASDIKNSISLTNIAYGSAGDQPQVGCSSLPGYIPDKESNLSETKTGKLSQTSVDISLGYDNMVLSNSLDCPRTSANITGDIGNGQFDRGPTVVDLADNYQHFEQNIQHPTIALNPFLNPSDEAGAYLPCTTRNEIFTQSERPLQQIQLYNYNNNHFVEPLSGSIDNNDTCRKYLYPGDYDGKSQSLDRLDMSGSILNLDVRNDHATIAQTAITETDSSSGPNVDLGPMSEFRNTCTLCGKSGFSTKGNLKRHWRAHSGEKPFKCDYCDSRFTEKKSLKIHVRRHTGEKPYKCHTCGKMFSQTGVLQSHMALHLNERKFDCQKCGKAFRQRSQLKLHLLRHDGVKRETCQTCMAKFLTKGDLERHCRIHTGERPYACKICNKTFTRQQSLNEHMNRHTGRKPYDCKYCEKTFSEMSACYKHAKTHKRQEQQRSSEISICQN